MGGKRSGEKRSAVSVRALGASTGAGGDEGGGERVGDARPASHGTRDRLVGAMSDALQRRGLRGVGIAELLDRADAPRGVLYHHFPGGKDQLAVAAIQSTVARLSDALDRLTASKADPAEVLGAWWADAALRLERSGFERGCPLATVALETSGEDRDLRHSLALGFAAIRDRLAAAFVEAGLSPGRAGPLAALMVAAYEGALMQARVAGDTRPMADAGRALVRLVRAELTAEAP